MTYLCLRLNSQTSPTTVSAIEQQNICQEAALRIHTMDGKDLEPGTTQLKARYVYVSGEGLCVYKGGFINNQTIHEYINDVMTNETLAEYISELDGTIIYGDKNQLENLELKYFNE